LSIVACRKCGIRPVVRPARFCSGCKISGDFEPRREQGTLLIHRKVIDNWKTEVSTFNVLKERKRGPKYQVPSTLILIARYLRTVFRLPFRQIQKLFKKHLQNYIGKIPDYTTLSRKGKAYLPSLNLPWRHINNEHVLIVIREKGVSYASIFDPSVVEATKSDESYLSIHFEIKVGYRVKMIVSQITS
jgi:hypothetical protein